MTLYSVTGFSALPKCRTSGILRMVEVLCTSKKFNNQNKLRNVINMKLIYKMVLK